MLPSSEHYQTRPEAALVDTVYTDAYGINMPRLTKKKKCAILLSILVLLWRRRPFLAFTTAFLFECVFAVMSNRQGRSCHIVTNSSSHSSSQKSATFARDRPHDLLRHMTRPIHMLLSHWPNYLEMFRCVVRLSAPIRQVPTSTNGVRLRLNMLSLHARLWPDGKRLSRSHGSVRTAPTTPNETSRCVASRLRPSWRSRLGFRKSRNFPGGGGRGTKAPLATRCPLRNLVWGPPPHLSWNFPSLPLTQKAHSIIHTIHVLVVNTK